RSLWTGGLFLIAATWVMRRPLDLKWLAVALIMAGLLFIANLVRVGVLVVIGQVAGWRLAAEMLHIPLGVLGFVAVCVVAVKCLEWQRPGSASSAQLKAESQDKMDPMPTSSARPSGLTQPRWLMPALLGSILAMGLIYTPRPEVGLSQSPPAWAFPAGLQTEPMPLTPAEFDWLTRDGAESADRRRFEWRGISGSMILITSSTWRAHHRPERCFEVYGLSLDDSRPHLVRPDLPLRFVSLGNGQNHSLLSATYWFQSSSRTTDDYAARIWADLPPNRERWVLVSILFDDVYDPNEADVQTLYMALHQTVAGHLEGEPSS
ncbi:MAG TPA: archaeosortase/exosortase family protein, partial [Anaerolineae bacterium]